MNRSTASESDFGAASEGAYRIRFNSIRFDSIRFGSVRFGSVRFDLIRFGSVRFDSIRFGSIDGFRNRRFERFDMLLGDSIRSILDVRVFEHLLGNQGGARFDRLGLCAVAVVGRFASIDMRDSGGLEALCRLHGLQLENCRRMHRSRVWERLRGCFLGVLTRFDSVDSFRDRADRFDSLLGSIDTRFPCH